MCLFVLYRIFFVKYPQRDPKLTDLNYSGEGIQRGKKSNFNINTQVSSTKTIRAYPLKGQLILGYNMIVLQEDPVKGSFVWK